MTTTLTAQSATDTTTRWFALFAQFAPLVFLIALMAFFTALAPRFLSPINLFNVMRQVSIFGILGVGMTFVIITRGIDLSVGSLVALTGLVAAVVAKGGIAERFALAADSAGLGWPFAVVAAILAGGLGGLVQGLAVTKLRVPSFVVTLGGMTVFRGLALIIGNGGPISGFDEAFDWWGHGLIGPVPVPVIVFAVVSVVAYIVLHHTRYGRNVTAIGSNPEGARLCGIAVDRSVTSVYVLVGLASGLGGFLLASRLNSAESVAGTQYELNVIAAVVIGGTSLYGGVGGITGTVIGTILIGILLNGLVILNVSPYVQQLIIGVIIVLAVAFDIFAKRRLG
jgi:inositol transport system permease protein